MVAGPATAVLLLAWHAASDRPECASSDFGACLGAAVLVAVIGVPLYLVAVWVGFRRSSARTPVLGVVAVVLGSFLLVQITEAINPPLLIWPVVAALVAAGYVLAESRMRAS